MEIRDKRKKVICDLVSDELYVPMKEKELAMFLQVAKEDREEFRSILQELLSEGKLMLTLKGKYMKSNGKVLTGTFISNAKGFGFVEIEGREEDLYIPEDKTGGAFHKDTVEVSLLPSTGGKRQEAQVAEMRRLEVKKLPEDIDYSTVTGLRLEAIEKLNKVRPENIGQASRISGVSPADISVLLIRLSN